MTRCTPGNTSTRPSAYVVGAQRAPRPLVSPEHVKGHLRLLRAFYNLRITVEDCKDRRIPAFAMQMDKDARWRWFVYLAVERYVPPSPSSHPPIPPRHSAYRLDWDCQGSNGGLCHCSSSHWKSSSRDIFHPWMSGWCGTPICSVLSNHSPCFLLLDMVAQSRSHSWYAEDCERLAVLQQLRLLNMFVVGSVGPHFLV